MFRLGFWEIVVILLVAVVFVNPKDLPKIARKIGYWYGKLRDTGKWLTESAKELEEEIRKPFEDVDEEIKKTARDIDTDLKELEKDDEEV